MIVNGKFLAQKILDQLKFEVNKLSEKGVCPKIVIITLGKEESWEFYIKQKLKKAEELGIQAELINLNDESEEALIKKIHELNDDRSIHGIIVQRPMPEFIDKGRVSDSISYDKDIDGFSKSSKFEVPIWLAVREILENVSGKKDDKFKKWITSKRIVVIGKGETGGKPVIDGLEKIGVKPIVIDKETENKMEMIKKGDIVISAVGKERMVEEKYLKRGAILIGIGTHKGQDGTLQGDYDEIEIKDKASFYTSTPGGIGPLNLAYLFKNLIDSALLA